MWDLHISSPPDCIDLVDEAGTLMNLSKVENPAAEYASKYLRERQRYILVRVISKFLSKAAQLSLRARTGLLQGWAALQELPRTPVAPCHSLQTRLCLWTGSAQQLSGHHTVAVRKKSQLTKTLELYPETEVAALGEELLTTEPPAPIPSFDPNFQPRQGLTHFSHSAARRTKH